MTGPAGNDYPPESTDERDHARPMTMRSAKWTEEESDSWDDDREQWLRENVPPHHI